MYRALLFNRVSGELTHGDETLIAAWRDDPETVLWLDIGKHDVAAERILLEEEFGLHALAVQDALRERHPPKLEVFDNAVFILLRGLDAETDGIEFGVIQLAVFVGQRFMVTRHNKPSLSANWLYERIVAEPQHMAAGVGALAVALTDRLIRRYLEILLGLEPRLEEIEGEIFEHPRDALLYELTRYKSRLRQIARVANYHLQIAGTLRQGTSAFIEQRLEHELTDVFEQLERTLSLADLYYETASDLTDGYLAFASHRLNRVMQILTVFTVIFVPLTFLAGIYGMNFDNMPELHSEIGYFVVIGLMLVIGFLQISFFRRRGWI